MESKLKLLVLPIMLLALCACTVPNSSSVSSSEDSSSETSTSETSSNETSSTSSETSSSEGSSSSSSSSSESGKYEFTHVEPNYTGTFYNSVSDTLRGSALILKLDALMDEDAKDANTSFTYSKMFTYWAYTDAPSVALQGSGQIVSFYSGKISTSGSMNREHTWPNSRKGNVCENDPHMVRPTISSENSSRGNDYFGETTGWDPASFSNPKYRGIAARVIFYCAVRYQENGLYLDDQNNPSATNAAKPPNMGKISMLLKWNLEYGIDSSEVLRNETLATKYNFCRNPFIDDRNYACKIWGTYNSTTKTMCGIS